MSAVRVLVGTHKGAFVLNSDAKRARWDVNGPLFAGWDIYHAKGSPVNPNRLYASQCSGWFGQQIQRSDDGGKTWEPVGNEFKYDGVTGTHQWYDSTQHPGSSSCVCSISTFAPATPTSSMPGWKTPRCSARWTAWPNVARRLPRAT